MSCVKPEGALYASPVGPGGPRHRRRRETCPRPVARREDSGDPGKPGSWPAPDHLRIVTLPVGAGSANAIDRLPATSWPAIGSSRWATHTRIAHHSGPAPLSPLAARNRGVRAGRDRDRRDRRCGPVVAIRVEGRDPPAVSERCGRLVSTRRPCGLQPSATAPVHPQWPERPPHRQPELRQRYLRPSIVIDLGPNTGATTLLEFSRGPGPNLPLLENVFGIFRQVDQQAPPVTVFTITNAPGRWRCWGWRSPPSSWRWPGGAGCALDRHRHRLRHSGRLHAARPFATVNRRFRWPLVASAAILCRDLSGARRQLRTSAALLGTLTAMLLSRWCCPIAIQFHPIRPAHPREQNTKLPPTRTARSWPAAGFRFIAVFNTGVFQRRHHHLQASAVFELAHLSRGSRRQIFLRGMRWAPTTSPARFTPWRWPTRAVHHRCCCCSAWPIDRCPTCSPARGGD